MSSTGINSTRLSTTTSAPPVDHVPKATQPNNRLTIIDNPSSSSSTRDGKSESPSSPSSLATEQDPVRPKPLTVPARKPTIPVLRLSRSHPLPPLTHYVKKEPISPRSLPGNRPPYPAAPMNRPQQPAAPSILPMNGPQQPAAPMNRLQQPAAPNVLPVNRPQQPAAPNILPMNRPQQPAAPSILPMNGPQQPAAPMNRQQQPAAPNILPMNRPQQAVPSILQMNRPQQLAASRIFPSSQQQAVPNGVAASSMFPRPQRPALFPTRDGLYGSRQQEQQQQQNNSIGLATGNPDTRPQQNGLLAPRQNGLSGLAQQNTVSLLARTNGQPMMLMVPPLMAENFVRFAVIKYFENKVDFSMAIHRKVARNLKLGDVFSGYDLLKQKLIQYKPGYTSSLAEAEIETNYHLSPRITSQSQIDMWHDLLPKLSMQTKWATLSIPDANYRVGDPNPLYKQLKVNVPLHELKHAGINETLSFMDINDIDRVRQRTYVDRVFFVGEVNRDYMVVLRKPNITLGYDKGFVQRVQVHAENPAYVLLEEELEGLAKKLGVHRTFSSSDIQELKKALTDPAPIEVMSGGLMVGEMNNTPQDLQKNEFFQMKYAKCLYYNPDPDVRDQKSNPNSQNWLNRFHQTNQNQHQNQIGDRNNRYDRKDRTNRDRQQHSFSGSNHSQTTWQNQLINGIDEEDHSLLGQSKQATELNDHTPHHEIVRLRTKDPKTVLCFSKAFFKRLKVGDVNPFYTKFGEHNPYGIIKTFNAAQLIEMSQYQDFIEAEQMRDAETYGPFFNYLLMVVEDLVRKKSPYMHRVLFQLDNPNVEWHVKILQSPIRLLRWIYNNRAAITIVSIVFNFFKTLLCLYLNPSMGFWAVLVFLMIAEKEAQKHMASLKGLVPHSGQGIVGLIFNWSYTIVSWIASCTISTLTFGIIDSSYGFSLDKVHFNIWDDLTLVWDKWGSMIGTVVGTGAALASGGGVVGLAALGSAFWSFTRSANVKTFMDYLASKDGIIHAFAGYARDLLVPYIYRISVFFATRVFASLLDEDMVKRITQAVDIVMLNFGVAGLSANTLLTAIVSLSRIDLTLYFESKATFDALFSFLRMIFDVVVLSVDCFILRTGTLCCRMSKAMEEKATEYHNLFHTFKNAPLRGTNLAADYAKIFKENEYDVSDTTIYKWVEAIFPQWIEAEDAREQTVYDSHGNLRKILTQGAEIFTKKT